MEGGAGEMASTEVEDACMTEDPQLRIYSAASGAEHSKQGMGREPHDETR